MALYRPESEDSSSENAIAAPVMLPNDDVVVDDGVANGDVSTTDASVQSPPATSTQVNISFTVEMFSSVRFG